MEGKKPLFIVKPGTMSRKDIQRAEKHAFVCVVECAEPDAVRFLEPPPDSGMDAQAKAALSLMRMIISSGSQDFKRGELTKWFVDQLLNTRAVPPPVPPVLSVPKAKG